MLIPFDRHLKRRQERDEYRQFLIQRIAAHHESQGYDLNDTFMQHVRNGFPLEKLESIVQKLDQEPAAHHS